MDNLDERSPLLNTRPRIPVIGVVGGIGSGKSSVANWVAEHYNVMVINADQLGHEALKTNVVKSALCQRFGNVILGTDGEIVRANLAGQVFGEAADQQAARRDLESIVHPEIGRQISAQIEEAAQQQRCAVLLDAAVLLETGWRDQCDLIVFIDTPEEIRLARVKQNRNWDEKELHRREMSQWSLEEKRQQSDLVVRNDGDLESAGRRLLQQLHDRGLIIIPR